MAGWKKIHVFSNFLTEGQHILYIAKAWSTNNLIYLYPILIVRDRYWKTKLHLFDTKDL